MCACFDWNATAAMGCCVAGALRLDPAGKVDSATPRAAVRVEALPSRTVLRWRVTWWSDDGAQAPESEAAEFTTGLRDVDWGTSKWIGGNAPWLRTEFNLDATPAPHDGVLALAIPSWFQLFVNGKRVGVTETVASTWTVYNVRTTYWTYDLSSVLQQGTNAIGIMLGRGWRNLDSYGVHKCVAAARVTWVRRTNSR